MTKDRAETVAPQGRESDSGAEAVAQRPCSGDKADQSGPSPAHSEIPAKKGRAVKWRKAVNEKCKDCIYDPMSGLGNWRQQVEACEIPDCPLWPIRPKSRPAG